MLETYENHALLLSTKSQKYNLKQTSFSFRGTYEFQKPLRPEPFVSSELQE